MDCFDDPPHGMPRKCALMSVENEQNHHNKISVFEAPLYLALYLDDTFNWMKYSYFITH